MRRIILFFLFVIIGISCQNRKRTDNLVNINEVIAFSERTEKTIEDAVDSIAYLTFETSHESIFANADKMIFRNGRIYIADYRKARLIVFDMAGNFIFCIDKRGRGTGEYLRFSSFTVDDNYIYMMDLDTEKVRKYNLSGEYIKEHDLPVFAMDMGVFDNGDIMLVTAPLDPRGFVSGQSLHRVFITDNNLTIHTSLFEYEQEKIDPVGKICYLHESKNDIVFHTMGSDIIHIFSKSNPNDIKNVLVDFGNNKVPDIYRSSWFEITERGFNFMCNTPILVENYLSLEINLGEYFETFLYDSENQQLLCQKETDSIIFPYPNGGTDGKYYTLLSGISQYNALVDGGFPKAPEYVEEHLEKEGTVMILYIMK